MNDHDSTTTLLDALPLDFTEFLSHRLNVHPSEAVSLLGECLVEYEPQQRYEIVVGPAAYAA
jgi:hypothetical protein